MTLQEDFERHGRWLFRWRSFLPLMLLPLIALSFIKYRYLFDSELGDHIWEVVCILTSAFGMGIRAWTIGTVPAGTSGRNTKSQVAEKLNTTGIYSIVRNPLYLGNFFMMLGVVLFTHHLWLVLVYGLLFMVYYERIIFTEEAFLKNKFGEEFTAWARVTPAFIPDFTKYRPSELKFNLKNVLRREYNGMFAFLISLFILEVTSDLIVTRHFTIDLGWGILVGIGFGSWITLRTLKNHTQILKVQGR